ncbi:Crossover junction endodeoxyribonuclease RuvC [compost metagenome]
MTRVIGIDQSSASTGIFSTFTGRGETIKGEGLSGPARLDRIETKVRQVLEAERPALVVLEGYAFSKKYSREQMGEVGGVVRLAIFRTGYEGRMLVVPPNTLKRFATGNQKATKAEMVDAARAKAPEVWIRNDHEADAFWLAKLGEFLHVPASQWKAWGATLEQVQIRRELLEKRAAGGGW